MLCRQVQFRTLPMYGALSTMPPWPQSKHVLYSKSRSCAIPPLFMNVWMQSTWADLDLRRDGAVVVVVALHAALAEEPRVVAIVVPVARGVT